MATANLTPIELILTAALSCACQMDAEAIQAWPMIAGECRDLANTPREQCLFDVTDTAMELADRGHVPDPEALLSGWMSWETEEYLMDAITA